MGTKTKVVRAPGGMSYEEFIDGMDWFRFHGGTKGFELVEDEDCPRDNVYLTEDDFGRA